jgi:UDP-N-acetyl-D-mannosaminouronate:lipid I N-acetyl-D-mannosaminouronosyltransferase
MPEFRIVNGIKIYGFQSKKDLIDFSVRQNKLLVAVNAEKIYNADPELKEAINQNIGYPDGVGAVWALRQKGLANVSKIPGVELWLEFIKEYHASKSFYFIGAREDIIQETVIKLKSEFPDIQLIGYRNGYIKQCEKEALIRDIEEKQPDFVFVAMGSPAQERLMIEMQKVNKGVYLGLGGSFDIYSGKTKRAPQLLIDMKMEWLYRAQTCLSPSKAGGFCLEDDQ